MHLPAQSLAVNGMVWREKKFELQSDNVSSIASASPPGPKRRNGKVPLQECFPYDSWLYSGSGS